MTERPVTPAEREAVAAFLAMEMHLVDCWACRKVEPEFQAAMARTDMEECRRLVPLFCAEMNRLAEWMTDATNAAFGRRQAGGGVGKETLGP